MTAAIHTAMFAAPVAAAVVRGVDTVMVVGVFSRSSLVLSSRVHFNELLPSV